MRSIPVLSARGHSLADAYEAAVVALWRDGVRVKTQYDKPGDPESVDCTMNITVEDPLSEPMIHKAFPGGIEDLREYVMEVKGAKDHWCKNMNDPSDERWEYTYHGRLARYGVWRELVDGESKEVGPFLVDQISGVIKKLSERPFTRQAQMITWMPNLDPDVFDPPCLQSLWYRILEDESGVWWLNCNVRFRSNDAWGANFMNMFGFAKFNEEVIAAGVSERSGREVRLARMNWHADSFHIYGKDLKQAEDRLFSKLETTSFEDRVFRLDDEIIGEIYAEAGQNVLEKIKRYDDSH